MIGVIWALMWKDLKIFFKDRGALVLILVQPFMFIVVMSYALAGMFTPAEDRLRVLVVNQDRGTYAAEVLASLEEMDGVVFEETWEDKALTTEQAERLIVEGERNIAVVFPPEFSERLEAENGSDGEMPPVQVRLVVDPATSSALVDPLMGTLTGIVKEVAYRVMVPRQVGALLAQAIPGTDEEKWAEQMQAMTAFQEDTSLPVVVERETPEAMPVTVYPDSFQQNVPGYTLYGLFWVVSLLAGSVMEERRTGTFRRLQAAPMHRAVMLAGKLAPYYVINLLQLVVMLGASSLLFGMSLGRSPVGLVVVSLVAAASATGLGVLVAGLARTESQIGGLTILLLLTFSALGGCFVPRFAMPEWLQHIGLITPHAWALDAYQDLLVRGYGVAQVMPEVAALMVFAALFFGIGVWRFRFE